MKKKSKAFLKQIEIPLKHLCNPFYSDNDCSEIQVSSEEKEKCNQVLFLTLFKCYLVTLLSLQEEAKLILVCWSGLCPNLVAVFANLK